MGASDVGSQRLFTYYFQSPLGKTVRLRLVNFNQFSHMLRWVVFWVATSPQKQTGIICMAFTPLHLHLVCFCHNKLSSTMLLKCDKIATFVVECLHCCDFISHESLCYILFFFFCNPQYNSILAEVLSGHFLPSSPQTNNFASTYRQARECILIDSPFACNISSTTKWTIQLLLQTQRNFFCECLWTVKCLQPIPFCISLWS